MPFGSTVCANGTAVPMGSSRREVNTRVAASMQGCARNFSAFKRYVPDGALEAFDPEEFLAHPCIDAATRVFTSRREDPIGTAVPFAHTVDPKGILQALVTDDHFHRTDNEVVYYKLIPSDDAKDR